MTPVEAMSTWSLERPSADATDDVTSSAWRIPSSPVATFAFFEITTTACADRLATLRREITTLGPANLLCVNTPAAEHGPSAMTTVKSFVVSFTPTLVTKEEKPRGRAVVTTIVFSTPKALLGV